MVYRIHFTLMPGHEYPVPRVTVQKNLLPGDRTWDLSIGSQTDWPFIWPVGLVQDTWTSNTPYTYSLSNTLQVHTHTCPVVIYMSLLTMWLVRVNGSSLVKKIVCLHVYLTREVGSCTHNTSQYIMESSLSFLFIFVLKTGMRGTA